ncbi:MAG TPA: hypothetical protein VND20_01715 [Candidatus Binataceae bacterium]|nr:hypothetical protein [Candidatus Binataceae bacterium]
MSDVDSAKYWLSWIELGSTIALFLVALGVGYEFVADRIAAPLRRQIEIAREAEMSALRTQSSNAQLESAKAQERAAEANVHAEEANARAAEANKVAEQERTARLKLEAILIRRLNWQQKGRIVGSLKGLHGYAIAEIFLTYPFDPEVNGIATQLRDTIHEAGWVVGLDIYKKNGDPLLGMLVEFEKGDVASQNIAARLVAVLQQVGLVVKGPEPASLGIKFETPASPRTIWLTIGRR